MRIEFDKASPDSKIGDLAIVKPNYYANGKNIS
jgi:hypothetical protein